jgi:glycine/D-amino acid oxidase-like deaminating enzyme
MRTLIVAGGVIGTSIAYHLAARGADVIVVERSAIACAASRKSGGFLAMDWCDGTSLMHLARRSFTLHKQLADEHAGDAVVIAMGPWAMLAAQWLPLPPVFGLKGHSLVFETGTAIPLEALFLEFVDESGSILSPEVFPRADGTTYVRAISSDSPLPTDPDLVVPDNGAIDRLKALCARISPILASSRILASQACFRRVTEDGLPVIGAIPGVSGAYLATGHSVWGILSAPATGEAVADLILDGTTQPSISRPSILHASRPLNRAASPSHTRVLVDESLQRSAGKARRSVALPTALAHRAGCRRGGGSEVVARAGRRASAIDVVKGKYRRPVIQSVSVTIDITWSNYLW